jgi:hypothetical protein
MEKKIITELLLYINYLKYNKMIKKNFFFF